MPPIQCCEYLHVSVRGGEGQQAVSHPWSVEGAEMRVYRRKRAR